MIIGISGKKGHGKDTVARMIQWLDSSYIREKVPQMEDYVLSERNHKILDQKWEIRKFADKLKDTVCAWIGCTREQLEDREFKETPLGKEWNKWKVYNPAIKDHKPLYCTSREEAEEYSKTYGLRLSLDSSKQPSSSVIEEIVMTPRLMMQLVGTECGRQIIHPNIWINALMADYKKDWKDSKSGFISEKLPNWIVADTRFPNEAQAIKDREGVMVRVFRPGMDDSDDHPSETSLDNYDHDWHIHNIGDLSFLLEETQRLLTKLNLTQ